jgi:hypothetical protein
MEYFRDISRRHEELKKRIHNFRLPLSPFYRKVATAVYVSIPIVAGYFIMQVAIAQSEKNLGAKGEKLEQAGRTSNHTGAGAGTADQKRALQMLLDRHKQAKEAEAAKNNNQQKQ